MPNHSITQTHAISHSGTTTKTVTLNTGGKFVDRDIDVTTTINVPAATTNISGSNITVSTGYVDTPINTNISGGSLSNSPTASVTYTDNTSDGTVIPSGGSLYINAGYFPNTKISLGHMIPDDQDYTNAGTGNILSGYEAYDTNGNKLIGTIPTITPSFTGGAVTASVNASVSTSPSVTVNSSGTMKTTTGYGVTSTKPSSGTDGTNYLTITSGTTRSNGTVSSTGNASSANVTYSANTTGYVNKTKDTVALSGKTATAVSKSTTVTPTVNNNFGSLYMPIVSASFSGGTVTATVDGSVTTGASATSNLTGTITDLDGVSTSLPSGIDGTNFYSITPSMSVNNGTVTALGNASTTALTYSNAAGAIAAHSGSTAKSGQTATQASRTIDVPVSANVGTTLYINKSAVSSTPSVVTSPSVALSGTATGFTKSSTATSYYVTVSGTASNGSIRSTHSATSGATPAISGATGSTASVTPAVTNNNSKVYLPNGSYSASVASHSISTVPTASSNTSVTSSDSSYTVTTLSSAPTGGKPYLTIKSTISSTAGVSTATGKATIGTLGMIPTGSTNSSADTKSITVSTSVGSDKYIEIYDGSYTVS